MSGAESGIEASSCAASHTTTMRQPEKADWMFVSEADRQEIEALMASIDARLTEAEQRADRMMARMGLS